VKVEPNGRAVLIQAAGTIGVGKSLTVSLLCRLFHEDSCRANPFKALNLTNVTHMDGNLDILKLCKL
jgi:cobyric acid synthase